MTLEQKERIVAMYIPRPQVPDDLIGALLFLSSDASAFMTGLSVTVAGAQRTLERRGPMGRPHRPAVRRWPAERCEPFNIGNKLDGRANSPIAPMIQIDARIIVSLYLVACRPKRVLRRWQVAERIIIVRVDRRGDLYHYGVHGRYRPSDRRLRPEN